MKCLLSQGILFHEQTVLIVQFLHLLIIGNKGEWLFDIDPKIEGGQGHAVDGGKLVGDITDFVIVGIGQFLHGKIHIQNEASHIRIMKLIGFGEIPADIIIVLVIIGKITVKADPADRITFRSKVIDLHLVVKRVNGRDGPELIESGFVFLSVRCVHMKHVGSSDFQKGCIKVRFVIPRFGF